MRVGHFLLSPYAPPHTHTRRVLQENNSVTELREKIKTFLASQGMIKGHSGSGPRTTDGDPPVLVLVDNLHPHGNPATPPTPTLSQTSNEPPHHQRPPPQQPPTQMPPPPNWQREAPHYPHPMPEVNTYPPPPPPSMFFPVYPPPFSSNTYGYQAGSQAYQR